MKQLFIAVFLMSTTVLFSQDLKTEIIPTLNHDLNGNTLLYSPTFEIAWDKMKQSLFDGEDIVLQNAPGLAKDLNNKVIDTSGFTSDNSLICAGVLDKLLADSLYSFIYHDFPDMKNDFYQHIGGIISLAYINLKLEYQTDFIVNDRPIKFDSNEVLSFGILYNPNLHKDIGKQVSIIDYKNRDNFIVEIGLSNKDYELFLAKVPTEDSINKLYNKVESRIKSGLRDSLNYNDIIQVPIIELNCRRVYNELMNNNFVNKCCRDLFIEHASQSIKFKMNEKGVEMSSESEISIFCIPQHVLVFNKPFLVLIRTTESHNPLFVGWFENAEFMIKK